jgi:hypothetical protein
MPAADTVAAARLAEKEPEFKDLLRDASLSDEDVLKKMNWEHEGPLYKIFVHQARRVMLKDMDVFLPYVMNVLGFFYFITLSLGITLELLISFALF